MFIETATLATLGHELTTAKRGELLNVPKNTVTDKLQQRGWFSSQQVADRLGISRRTVNRMRAEGEIPAVKFRGSWRIPESWLIEQEEKARRNVA